MTKRELSDFTDDEVIASVAAPKINRIDGRKTTITGTFAKAIMPVEPMDPDDIRKALDILGMTPATVWCTYCGDPHTEWDHFRATARDLRATGFGTTSRNLVPSCSKCNQSRGNQHWRTWIYGAAPLAPARRRPDGLEERVRRLAEYELWSEHPPVDYSALVPLELWNEYWAQCDAIVVALERAQAAAEQIRTSLRTRKS